MQKPFIMVVDDNKITTKLLRRYLEANGYEAKEAYDGIDCLEKVEERLPDAIVLDVMMPRLDGYETAKRLKAQDHTKHIPVVIVTALNDVANQIKSIEAGADDFLSKPIEEKLLIAKVRLLSSLNLETKKNRKLLDIIEKAKNGEININEVSFDLLDNEL
jgi:two-component system cell cycle response regulator